MVPNDRCIKDVTASFGSLGLKVTQNPAISFACFAPNWKINKIMVKFAP